MTDLRQTAVEEALRQGVDPHLILRQMGAESGGDPDAMSPKGARGAMQLMPATARELGVDPSNPADNVRGGVTYMKQQLDAFGDPRLALAAYNAGPGAVRKAGGVPNYPETQAYVKKVAGPSGGSALDDDVFGPTSASAAQSASSLDSDVFAPTEIAGEQRTVPSPTNPGSTALEVTPVATRKDQGLGFMSGLMRPLDNASMALEGGLSKLGVPVDKVNQFFGTPSAAGVADSHAAYLADQERQGIVPGKLGEFAGNVVGTLPLATLGPVAGGAAGGALLTHSRDPMNVGMDAVAGAVGGKVASSALGAARSVIAPQLQKAAGALTSRGVSLTPGDILGGTMRKIEDRASSLPFIGDTIAAARGNSVQEFNRAAVNDVLAPIGKILPKAVDTGHDAVAYAGKTLGDAYASLLPKLKIQADQPFVSNVVNLRGLATNLEPAQAKLFDTLTKRALSKFSGTGQMSGEAMKTLDTELGQEFRLYQRSQAPADQKYADAVRQLQTELRDMVSRSNPNEAPILANINKGYASLLRVESAAGKALDGMFTGAGLRVASRQADSSLYKRQSARGGAIMQDLAEAGQKVLGNRTPDSGSAGRLAQQSSLATGFGALANMLGGGLYSPKSLNRIGGLLTHRPASAPAIADLLALFKAPAVAGGGAAVVDARNPRPQP